MSFLQHLRESHNTLSSLYEVESVLNGVIGRVEEHASDTHKRGLKSDLDRSHTVAKKLLRRIDVLEGTCGGMAEELGSLRSKAAIVREKFTSDVFNILKQSKNTANLMAKISDLEERIHVLSENQQQPVTEEGAMSKELDAATTQVADSTVTIHSDNGAVKDDEVADNSNSPSEASAEVPTSATPATKVPKPLSIDPLLKSADKILLSIFSFNTTVEVLNLAQVNRRFFSRIDEIFGMDSELVKSWGSYWESVYEHENGINGVESNALTNKNGNGNLSTSSLTSAGNSTLSDGASPSRSASIAAQGSTAVMAKEVAPPTATNANGSATAAVANAAQASIGLTREMVHELSVTLKPNQLQAIISLTDRLKKENQQVATLITERDDTAARLQNAESVRDFLVDKLKSAEMAIKASMVEIAALKRQQAADQEVISFLDIRGQELETVNAQLSSQNTQLKASYDLQSNSHSHLEMQLQAELAEYKLKLEENDTAFKTQKKLLVKEVKSLRFQMEAIAKERDQYRSQLNTLRDALMLSPVLKEVDQGANGDSGKGSAMMSGASGKYAGKSGMSSSGSVGVGVEYGMRNGRSSMTSDSSQSDRTASRSYRQASLGGVSGADTRRTSTSSVSQRASTRAGKDVKGVNPFDSSNPFDDEGEGDDSNLHGPRPTDIHAAFAPVRRSTGL